MAVKDSKGRRPEAHAALRCYLAAPGAVRPSVEEWSGSLESLASGSDVGPVTYLVPKKALSPLRGLQSSFVVRRRKHPRTWLSRLLLGHKSLIPFTAAKFDSPGRALQSVRTLLANATQHGEQNIYVIGVSSSMLDEIRRIVWPAGASATALSSEDTTGAQTEKSPVVEYLRLLGPDTVQEAVLKQLREKLVGDSAEMDLVRRLIVLASRHDEPVLILGDSGTGKEVAARAIHDLDERRRRWTFMAVNCGAIPPELFESELFGYVRGALADARHKGKRGLWVLAGEGTLFLDEIGDLSLRHQVKLLRALNEGAVRPVGGVKNIDVHCRVIAATNRDLYEKVQAGEFREDLYYRLRPVFVRMPRLRDHPQDVPVLAQHFWRFVAPNHPALADDVLAELARYRWPGNARELRAVLVSLAMFPSATPRPEHVRAVFHLQNQAAIDDERLGAAEDARLHRVECLRHLRRADEIIRACKVLLQPLGTRPLADATARLAATIPHRLAELRLLDAQPALFHTIATFDIVHHLAGHLATFNDLFDRSGTEARTYWRRELRREITATLAAIMREVERLLRQV